MARTSSTPYLFDAQSNTAASVRASRCRVTAIRAWNPGAALAWVQLYDLAVADVVVGTSTRRMSIPVPPGGGISEQYTEAPAFGTQLSIAATSTAAGGVAPDTALQVEIHVGGY